MFYETYISSILRPNPKKKIRNNETLVNVSLKLKQLFLKKVPFLPNPKINLLKRKLKRLKSVSKELKKLRERARKEGNKKSFKIEVR